MWVCGAALAALVVMTATLLAVVMVNGLGVFWPHAVARAQLAVAALDQAHMAGLNAEGTLRLAPGIFLEDGRLTGLTLWQPDEPSPTPHPAPHPRKPLAETLRAVSPDVPPGRRAVRAWRADGQIELDDGTPCPVAISDGRRVQGISLDGRLLVHVIGQWMAEDIDPDTRIRSVQFKTGNREFAKGRQDFFWFRKAELVRVEYPKDLYVLEREENGSFFGFLRAVVAPAMGQEPAARGSLDAQLAASLAAVRAWRASELRPIADELALLSDQLRGVRDEMLRIQYVRSQLAERGKQARNPNTAALDLQLSRLRAEADRLKARSDALVAQRQQREAELRRNVAVFLDASGQERTVALSSIVRAYQPNAMGWPSKAWHYMVKLGELFWENPRESNTEGGLFPAIFGTVLLVFLMAILCFPLGVLAGIYLGEYAREGLLVRLVRIGVNNLAGIPSIVYGIFGLGFFIYQLGATIDQVFFPARTAHNEPTFGTGGILWASLTLGLLTVPVVIVATEEALRTIPQVVREGSYALGATKFQTLVRVLLPMASPGIMTGLILAMSRAAGEVAPLMITGVVKLAPQLPVDGRFPFVHLDRKFMHLGFHIYDIGFQSPNVEASKPMVYVTTLVLLSIVLVLSSTAIYVRNRMRTRFQVRTM